MNKKIILQILTILLLIPLITEVTYQYQENADETGTGGTQPLNNSALVYDGNWTTSTYIKLYVDGISYAYMNYTIPSNIEQTSTLWQIKIGASTYLNLTIPLACWNINNKIILRLTSGKNHAGWTYYSSGDCWNNSAWNILAYKGHVSSSGYRLIYEEGVYWGEIPTPTGFITQYEAEDTPKAVIDALIKNILGMVAFAGLLGLAIATLFIIGLFKKYFKKKK